MTLEKLSNKVNPKKNIYRSIWKWKIDKITRQNWEHRGGGRRENGRGRGGEKGSGEENWREKNS